MATSNSKNQVSRVQAGDNKANATEAGVLAGSNGTGNALSDDSTTTGVLSVSAIRTGAVSATGVAGTIGVALQGLYGRLTINQDGTYVYVVDNSNATVNALAKGESLQESFTYTASNGSASAQAAIVVKVNGANDAATITGLASGAVLEDGATAVASGKLTVTDVDRGESLVKTDNEQSGEYGKFSITADGAWTYVLNKNSSDVQSLSAGETVTEKFVVTSKDGTASQNVSVTVTGTNDVARIEGDARGALTEDAKKTVARGELNIKDTDHGESAARVVTDQAGTYGSFSIDANGRWTYVLNNSLVAVQALAQGEKGTDSFVVWSKDGSVSQTVTMTINGVNDAATITGADTGSVNEDASPNTATGKLTVNDVDHGENAVVPVVNRIGSFGSFSIAEDGTWTYTLNNSLATVQALGAGVVRTESFIVYSKDSQLADLSGDDNDDEDDHDDDSGDDGHDEDSSEGDHDDDGSDDDHQTSSYHGASKVLTVTIIGTNDAAVITGSSTGAVTEDLSLATSGQLSATDVDTGEIGFRVQSAIAGAYGSFSVDAGGHWTYGLNNAAANVQALAANEAATDTFTVKSFDGTEKLVTVTVTGTNDAASISGASAGATTEDTTITTSGTLTVADVDHDEAMVQAQANVAGAYGSFNIAADGNWTYALNNAVANVQALGSGEQASDSFVVVSKDGSASQTVTVNISGTNDAPVVTNTAAALVGAVKEDTTLSASGQLSASDIDHGATQTWSVQGNATGAYGTIAVDVATGQWTYDLSNAATNVQALAAGETHTETFTVRVTDDQGSAVDQSVTVTVTGTNDVALVATTDITGAVTEQGAPSGNLTDSSSIAFTDADLTDAHSVSAVARSAGALGTLTASVSTDTTGNGTGGVVSWNYSVADSAVEYLAAGQTKVESFSFNVLDGHGGSVARTVDVTVTGTNDAPVLQGTQTDQLYTSSLSVWTPFLVNNGVWVTPTGASSGDTVPHTFVRQFTAAQDGNYVFQFAVDNEGSVLVDGVAIPGLYNNDWSHSTVQTVALTAGIHTVTMNALNWGGPAAFAMNITDPNNHEIWNTRTHLDPEPLILSYTENQAAMVVSAGLTLTDIDSPTMTHATVAVGTGFAAGQDILGFANQNGISGAYDASTGVLSLIGSATQAQYQAALRSVTYSNSSDSPSTADRAINFVVDDGSSQSNLSNTVQSKIVILAVNDAATISGTSTGTVIEDTTLTTGGSLAVSDVDSGEAVFRVQTAAAGTYGSFSIGTSGNWSYTLNNSAANVQALNTADHVSDSFTVLSQDGTASQVVTVGINGLDDNRPPVAANDNLGSGTGAVNFNLLANDTDPDAGSVLSVNSFDALSANGVAISVVNGLATMNTAGSAAYKALAAGQTLVDTFTYDIKDQLGAVSNRATGTYTLIGVNDAASMTGDVAGSVKEDTTLSASGRLVVTDPDSGQSFARAQTTTGTYGTFTVDVNGNWAYNLNNSLSAVQALAQGSTVNQTFTVASQDNSASKIVTVAVNGTNDAPVAANDAISGGVLTFEAGTYTQSGNTITTGDFKFDGSYFTGYWGADYTNSIYSSGWYSTSPITMTRTDGQSFKLESANVTGYSYGYGQATETVTGYLHGVQVASQAFAVPESAYGARNNTVALTNPGFSAVDRVVFSLSGPYYEYQWLDNITIPNTVAQARDVSVLLNDTDVDAGARLSVASFSGFSAHGAAISLNANGTLHYDPTVSAELQAVHQGVNVYDTFTYQSQDEFGALSNLATVGVTVVGVHA